MDNFENQAISILAYSGCSALGDNVLSCATAMFNRQRGLQLSPSLRDSTGAPIRVAMAPWLTESTPFIRRYFNLLGKALSPVIAVAAQASTRGTRIGMWVTLPEPRAGTPLGLSEHIEAEIKRRYDIQLTLLTIERNGASGALSTLTTVSKLILQGEIDAGIVAAVDSHIDLPTLRALESRQLLQGLADTGNPFGIAPGEGAAALLLASEYLKDQLTSTPTAYVLGVGTGEEPVNCRETGQSSGTGLSTAIEACLAQLPEPFKVNNIFTNFNGERYRAHEYLVCEPRFRQRFSASTHFVTPADFFGDAGAACGLLQISMAMSHSSLGYLNGPISLTWASNESGPRTAAVMLHPTPQS